MPNGVDPGDISSEESVIILLKQMAEDVKTLKKDRARLDGQRERDRDQVSELNKTIAVTNERLGNFMDNYDDHDDRISKNETKINYGVGAIMLLQLIFVAVMAYNSFGG